MADIGKQHKKMLDKVLASLVNYSEVWNLFKKLKRASLR